MWILLVNYGACFENHDGGLGVEVGIFLIDVSAVLF